MTSIGAIYILWLAWKIIKSKPLNESECEKGTNTFINGLVLQFVNPKAILYAFTITSTFIIPYYNSICVLSGFSIFLAFLAFISTSCWALFGSVFHKFIGKNVKVFNAIMALLLVYCAVSLFL